MPRAMIVGWVTITFILGLVGVNDGCFVRPQSYQQQFRKGRFVNKIRLLAVDDSSSSGGGINDEVNESDKDSMNPLEFRSTLKKLFTEQNGSTPKVQASSVPMYSLSELESYLAASSGTQKRLFTNLVDDSDMEDDDNDDAMFLDPDIYVSLQDWVDEDGSIPLSNLNYDQPSVSPSKKAFVPTVDDNYRAMLRKIVAESSTPTQSNGFDVAAVKGVHDQTVIDSIVKLWNVFQARAKDLEKTEIYLSKARQLHETVFAEEVGYLNQSNIFRESLLDRSKVVDALKERRMKRYNERHHDLIETLEQQIDELEAKLLQNKSIHDASSTPQQQQQQYRWEHLMPNDRTAEETSNGFHNSVCCANCNCQLASDEIFWELNQSLNDSTNDRLCRICYSEKFQASSRMQPKVWNSETTSPRTYRSNSWRLQSTMLSPKQLGIAFHPKQQQQSLEQQSME